MSDDLVVPVFKTMVNENKAKSKAAGRPIFDEMEVVEVRFAGNKQTVSVFPALEFSRWITVDGEQVPQTYAERWPEQYKRFKAKKQQIKEGTPVDELPFLTASKRAELKALSIYTAESLAALDGQELKNLGQGGRELKNQAKAYLDNAAGTADVSAMAAEIEALKRTIAEMQADKGDQSGAVSPFEEWDDAAIKDWIEERVGERPKGNPSHKTLVERADEINAGLEHA